jgi:hypothetical protein
MQFEINTTHTPEESIFAADMTQGDIGLITSGLHKGKYIVCTYARVMPNGTGSSHTKAWTTLNDPQLDWQGWIPDMTVRLVQLGETITIKRSF